MSTEKDEKAKAADKRRQAEVGYTDEERKEQLISALTAERQGYVSRGLDARVEQVDAELAKLRGKATARSRKASDPADPAA